MEAALAVAERPPEAFADLGTGTGAVALALAREWPDTRILATELSGAAAVVARENADRLGMAARVEVLEGIGWKPSRPGIFPDRRQPPRYRHGRAGARPGGRRLRAARGTARRR
ncbi:MAG: methyltransferase [Arhodomonas sp.]|nr:methyltransferase [Arhodomonas sp.]